MSILTRTDDGIQRERWNAEADALRPRPNIANGKYAAWQQGECPNGHGHQCSAALKCPVCCADLTIA